jgi:predicted fused transcriptional regulator/phosphomethylpyrimidine kinase
MDGGKGFQMYWDENQAGLPYNIMHVDRFVRSASNPAFRKDLIDRFKADPVGLVQYEREKDLPAGACQLVLMMEDEQIRTLERRIMSNRQALTKDAALKDALIAESTRVRDAMAAKYPQASMFLENYARLMLKTTGGSTDSADSTAIECQFVWAIGAVAVFVVAAAVIYVAANVGVAANAYVSANAVANANVVTNVNVSGG